MKTYFRPFVAVVISTTLLAAAVASARHQQRAARAVVESVTAYNYVAIHGTQTERDAACGAVLRALKAAEGR